MTTLRGPSLRELDARGDAYAKLVVSAQKGVLDRVARDLPTSRRVTADDVSRITDLWNARVDVELLPALLDEWHATASDVHARLVSLLAGALVAQGGAEEQPPVSGVEVAAVPQVADPIAEAYMAEARNRLVGVGDVIWDHARDGLLDGMREGDSTVEMRNRIVESAQFSEARAESIARTEVIGASNHASLTQMKAAGVRATKEWIATNDPRTREAHAAVDGTIVDLDDNFMVGGWAMQGPHAPGAPAGLVVNCRCTLGYDILDEALAADAFHMPGKHNQGTHGHGGQHEHFAPTAEHEAILQQARVKVANAPTPTADAVKKAQAELARAKAGEGRAGGESRGGSAASRRKQRENLFNEFDGNKRGYVPCHGCGVKMHHESPGPKNPKGFARLERGKIFVKCQGGGYQLPNLLPECFGCNRGRGDSPVRNENKC